MKYINGCSSAAYGWDDDVHCCIIEWIIIVIFIWCCPWDAPTRLLPFPPLVIPSLLKRDIIPSLLKRVIKDLSKTDRLKRATKDLSKTDRVVTNSRTQIVYLTEKIDLESILAPAIA